MWNFILTMILQEVDYTAENDTYSWLWDEACSSSISLCSDKAALPMIVSKILLDVFASSLENLLIAVSHTTPGMSRVNTC